MAATELTNASALPTLGDHALGQPKDAVPMEKMEKKEETAKQPAAGAGVSIQATSDDKDATLAITSHSQPETQGTSTKQTIDDVASTSKEKGKEQPLAPSDAAKDEDDDALQIHPSDPDSTNSNTSPVCNITLLLPTGARHPYRIDEKYLSKRSVEIPETNEAGHRDPFSISVYKLKELILREWRDEWDGKPASPSSIRLIHFGKLLDDKEQLNSRSILSGEDTSSS